MTEPLRVTAVTIRDVLGARELALEPGRITVLRGENASGKTTVLAALQAALNGGNLARLARVGAEGEPEAVLVLEGPGFEAYRVERKADKVRIRARVGETAAFEDVGKPQSWLRSLFDPQGCNPVAFLQAADKDRALMLLEALPLTLNREELAAILGDLEAHVPPIPEGLHPLEELGLVREGIFRARTGVNRDQKGKAAAADQTRRNAPAVVPMALEAELAEALAAVEAAAGQAAALVAEADAAEKGAIDAAVARAEAEGDRLQAEFEAYVTGLRSGHAARAESIRQAAELRIAELAAELGTAIDAARTSTEAAEEAADREAEEARQAARAARAEAQLTVDRQLEDLTGKRERLATLRERAETAARARGLHEQAKQFEAEAEGLKAEADRMTAALDALDAYRRRMAENLPIEGLEIEGKVIRVHGIPFEQLNTAQRIEIAVKVACLRAQGSRLPVVFVDGAEALDSEHFALLVEALERAGVQAFIGRVEDHDLTVEARP